MSLLSSLRRALAPKVTPVEPPGPMELGGLQLECPVCSYDVFLRRPIGTLDPLRLTTEQRILSLPAIACTRCGAVQLFDPTARRDPGAPIPPRRVARLQHRPRASGTVAAVEEDAVDDDAVEAGEAAAWTVDEGEAASPGTAVGADATGGQPEDLPSSAAGWDLEEAATGHPGPTPGPDASAGPPPDAAPTSGWPSADAAHADVAPAEPLPSRWPPPPPRPPGPDAPVWPTPLPPLPPLPPLDQSGGHPGP